MSKRNITFTPSASEDYEYGLEQDKKLLKKINSLIKSIQRDSQLEGEGKPEPLKGNLQGYCSRRIYPLFNTFDIKLIMIKIYNMPTNGA